MPKAEVYLALNDPYSFMLIQVLASLESRFSIQCKLFLVYESVPGINLNMDLIRRWSLKDANYIARQYNLKEAHRYPSSQALITGQQTWQLEVKDISSALNVFTKTWFDEFDDYYLISTPVINFQITNQIRLIRKGHYEPASIFFCGDWFVGIDRLFHFEECLHSLGLHQSGELHLFEKNDLALCENEITHNMPRSTLDVFITLNCPYSYIGFMQAVKLAQHYQIKLNLKLIAVEPVTTIKAENKQRYFFVDACREAVKLDIPLTSFTDPQAKGISYIYAIFPYAETQNKSVELIKAAFERIFVTGIDLAQIHQVKELCSSLGLDFAEANTYGENHDWQTLVEKNLLDLEAMNFWDVPCFRYQDTTCWGQDRFRQIEEAIQNTSV